MLLVCNVERPVIAGLKEMAGRELGLLPFGWSTVNFLLVHILWAIGPRANSGTYVSFFASDVGRVEADNSKLLVTCC